MKTPIYVIFAITGFMGSCAGLEARKDVDIHIYCQQDKYKEELQLYVNDTFKGKIPFSPEKFTCDKPAPKGITFDLKLLPGTYNIKATSLSGQLVSKGTLILTEDNMELLGLAGGMDARQSEQCLYLEIL